MRYFTIISGSIPSQAFEKFAYIASDKVTAPKPENLRKVKLSSGYLPKKPKCKVSVK